MLLTRTAETSCYRFENLAGFPEVAHGVFARSPGESEGPFAGLNISLAAGDDPSRVAANRGRVARCLGAAGLTFARQVHGSEVAVVDGRPPDPPPAADALVTGHPGAFLMIAVADCQPILMYDPQRRVAAAVHSGWRGSIRDIAGRTVAVMRERFGSRPEDIRAGIGPSLGPCCAEFVNYREEIPAELWRYRHDRVLFDFWAMTRDQLVRAGVPPGQIETAGLCTRCRTDLFFSHRGEQRTGRFPAVIGIKDRVQGVT
jgi:YfiH family protein